MKKRIFSIFMVFTLCFVSVDQVYADAGSLIIAGGSVAGVTAGAIAGPAVVAVFCAMMAFGMNVELTQASEEAGLTKTEFLKTKLEQYCTEAQITYDTFNKYILEQANVFQNGAISITDQASQLIQRFCNWLFEYDGVSSAPPTSIVVDGVSYQTIAPGSNGVICSGAFTDSVSRDLIYVYNSGDYPIAPVITYDTNHDYAFYIVSLEPFQNIELTWKIIETDYNYVDYQGSIINYTNTLNSAYYSHIFTYVDGSLVNNEMSTTIPIFEGDITQFMNSIEGLGTNADRITGDESDYDVSKHVLNPTQDKTVVINPNITIPVPVDKDVTIDVNEYIDLIQDLIDGVADDIITAIDDATGVPIVIDWDPTQDWDPTIEKEDDTDLPDDEDKTPVVPDERIPIDYDIDPLTFDLKGVFPFCIPWDIKDMLSKLNSSPIAPSYTVNWHIPIVNETLTFTIDLSPYDDVANILRKMEVLAFCIGLALITRQMILRG